MLNFKYYFINKLLKWIIKNTFAALKWIMPAVKCLLIELTTKFKLKKNWGLDTVIMITTIIISQLVVATKSRKSVINLSMIKSTPKSNLRNHWNWIVCDFVWLLRSKLWQFQIIALQRLHWQTNFMSLKIILIKLANSMSIRRK